MNDQTNNWVWDYEKHVMSLCKTFFGRDTATIEDVTHNVLVKLSQKAGLDQIRNRAAWIRTSARNECLNYSNELRRQRVLREGLFESPPVGADEKLSDEKLDKEARGIAEVIDNVVGEPDSNDETGKIDPVKAWHSYKRRDPDMAAQLIRSSRFVREAFDEIRWWRRSVSGLDQEAKLVATLFDAKQMIENILGTCTDEAIKEYADSIRSGGTGNIMEDEFNISLQYHIRQIIESFSLDDFFEFAGIDEIAPNWAKKSSWALMIQRSSVTIDLFDCATLEGGGVTGQFYHYRMRIRDFIHSDPDPLYVLYRVWNRILRKGRKGKYGNRKLLETLLFAFKEVVKAPLNDDTVEYVLDNTFNSLTEKTNLETLRTMSYRLTSGYSKLADYIYRKSVRHARQSRPPQSPSASEGPKRTVKIVSCLGLKRG